MEHTTLDWSRYAVFLVPLVLLQLALMTVALRDLMRRKSTRGPRWVWALVIVFVNVLGPLIYFTLGRTEE
jgi:hypothetical protein